ncbi:hypothetical protein M9458_039510, partial [Cirrhinus mrigala]
PSRVTSAKPQPGLVTPAAPGPAHAIAAFPESAPVMAALPEFAPFMATISVPVHKMANPLMSSQVRAATADLHEPSQ